MKMVAVDWEWSYLGKECKTTSGGTPSRDISRFYNGSIPWLKSGELNDGVVSCDQIEEHITEEAIKESSAKVFPAGTLLIAMYGATVGKLGTLSCDAATNQAVCAIFPNNKIHRDYLFYYLLHERENLIDRGAGGAQPNISQNIIRDLKLPLPPLDEQKRIAAILEEADHARRTRRFTQSVSDTFLQEVFVEMFGDPVTNPMGWEVVKLGDLATAFEGGTNFNPVAENGLVSEWRVLKISAVTWGDFNPDESKPISPSETFDDRLIVREGDLIFSRANTTELVGATSLVRAISEKVLLPDKLWRIKLPTNAKVLPEFLLYVLRHPSIRYIIGLLATGSSGSMKNISKAKTATLPIIVPPIKDQKRFTDVVKSHEQAATQQYESARQAEHLFQTLLHRAFRGEV